MHFSKSVKDLILSNDPFNSSNHASPDQVLFASTCNKLWRLPGKVRQRRAILCSLPAFHGHAGNISVNYSVYGYVESNGRHWEADFVRRSGHTCLLNTCSQLLIVNFSVFVASLTGLRCIPLDFMLFISRMKIRTKFLNRANTLMCKNWTLWQLCQFIIQWCAYVFVVPNFCTHNWRVQL